jgi:hypothetical protein
LEFFQPITPFKDPARRKEYLAAWRTKNVDRLNEYRRKYYQENPDKRPWKIRNPERAKVQRQREHFKSRYGITIEQYDAMVIKREGRCDICGRVPEGGGSTGRLNVDHYELVDGTKVIRGLLCWQCNIAIGYLQHDKVRLSKAIGYLDFGGVPDA